jgi:hypothetical protein
MMPNGPPAKLLALNTMQPSIANNTRNIPIMATPRA